MILYAMYCTYHPFWHCPPGVSLSVSGRLAEVHPSGTAAAQGFRHHPGRCVVAIMADNQAGRNETKRR